MKKYNFMALFMSLICVGEPLVLAKEKPMIVQSVAQVQIQPSKKYNFKLKDGKVFKKIRGSAVTINPDQWVVTDKKGQSHQFNSDQLAEVQVLSGNRALMGLGIGSVVGVILGAAIAIPKFNDKPRDRIVPGCDDDCSMETAGPVKSIGSFVGISSLVAGAGAVAGLMVPKKQSIHIVPLVAHDEKTTVGGAAVSFAF